MEDGTTVEICPECDRRGTVKVPPGLIAICATCGGEGYIEHECPDDD